MIRLANMNQIGERARFELVDSILNFAGRSRIQRLLAAICANSYCDSNRHGIATYPLGVLDILYDVRIHTPAARASQAFQLLGQCRHI